MCILSFYFHARVIFQQVWDLTGKSRDCMKSIIDFLLHKNVGKRTFY